MSRSLGSWLCVGLALIGPVRAAEECVLGGAARPWASSGAATAGVVDYADDLASVRNDLGQALFGQAGSDTVRGWLMPRRLRSDFNISRDVLAGGGAITVNLPSDQVPEEQLTGILSGDHTIAFDRKFVAGKIVQNNGVAVEVDLGARYGVNRVVFYPRMTAAFPFQNDFLRAYELYTNDGLPTSLYASGRPIYTSPAIRVPDNSSPRVEAELEAQFVRFLRLKSITTVGFEIDELEVYGTGFVPEATYVSNVLDLGSPRVWGAVRWVERQAGPTRQSDVQVRLRCGSDDTPDVYYRILTVGTRVVGRTVLDERGDTLTKAAYEALLRSGQRGEIEPDAAHWSQWQVLANGGSLELPAPRRYVQLRVDFANYALDAARALGEIAFGHGAPALDGIVAEISPAVTEPGARTRFTLVARVVNHGAAPGFERFRVETPSRVAAIHSVEVFDRDLHRVDGAEFGADADLSLLPVRAGAFAIEAVTDGYFSLRVPRIAADGARLRVVFDAAAYRYGTRFRGSVFADDRAELAQHTEAGDATPELDTDDLLVRVSVGSQVLAGVEVIPPVLSPNGDGINDRAEVVCTVLHLLAPAPLRVQIRDLAGRSVRSLTAGAAQNGLVNLSWDGRDDGGELVPPGVYLVAAAVESDTRTERRVCPVAVAY